MRLIDFEYSNFNIQCSDIGNFFNEFIMDYLPQPPVAPYFNVDKEKYLSIDQQRVFVSIYLSEYLERPVMESNSSELIGEFVDSIDLFSRLSHMTWGLWSIIRASQGETFDSFDFITYAQFRFDCYFDGNST